MIVAMNMRPYAGPWGGGNRFVKSLVDGLSASGHQVVFDLARANVDQIIMIDPRTRAPNVSFGAGSILRYLLYKNPNAVVIHRINECDERKGSPFINHRLARANYSADWTVFVGRWLMDLPVWKANLHTPASVIHNGADPELFHNRGQRPWNGVEPLRLVTHHWGYHPMKGFDVYKRLDEMLGDERWRDRIAFTYIGQLPAGFQFSRARYVSPLDGEALANELRSHHAYVTGSMNEPGGNHQNEGALCGLPLLYRSSGCMPEYCDGFGIAFGGPSDLEQGLAELMTSYPALHAKMPSYPNSSPRMLNEWLELLSKIYDSRKEIVARRRVWRDPLQVLANQLPF